MAVIWIILIVIVILAFIFALKILKKIVKITVMIFCFILLCIACFGFIVHIDLQNFEENLTGNKNIVLINDDKIYAGALITSNSLDFTVENIQNNFKYYNKNALNDLQAQYNELSVWKPLPNEKNVYLFVQEDYLVENISLNFELLELELNENDIRRIMRIDDAYDVSSYVFGKSKLTGTKENIVRLKFEQTHKAAEQFKSELMISVFKKKYDEQGQDFIFDGIKNGNIYVYPDTISLKILKLLPKNLQKIIF